MSKIPKAFLKPSNLTKAIMSIRHWLNRGLTVVEMARQITEVYASATEREKESLGKLLSAVYDFSDSETAQRCCDMFNVFGSEEIVPDRPLSYQLLMQCMYEGKNFKWLQKYDQDNLRSCATITYGFRFVGSRMIVSTSQMSNVISLCQFASLFCVIEPSFRVNLFVMFNDYGSYEVNEFQKGDTEEPYYQGVERKVLSPVFKAQIFKKVLDFCLERVGFPRMDIHPMVIFCPQITKLKNIDKWKDSQAWKEVEIRRIPLGSSNNKSMMECPHRNFIKYSRDVYDREMLNVFDDSLCAASIIFTRMHNSHTLLSYSHEDLEKLAKHFGIFSDY